MSRRIVLLLALLPAGLESPGRAQESSRVQPVVVTTLPHPVYEDSDAAPSPGPVVVPPMPLPPPPLPPPPPCVPGPPACAPCEACNGGLLCGDPWLDRPEGMQPGWFANLELGVIQPNVLNQLIGLVDVSGIFTDIVALPVADLSWTGSPRVELGYRFCQGAGELLVVYRNVTSEGCASIADYDLLGDGVLKSRFNMNVIDLDYASQEFALGPLWDMKWRAGVRIATIFFDSRAEGALLQQQMSNRVVGAGPQAGLDLARYLCGSRWALFSKVEGAGVLARVTQDFQETIGIGVPIFGGATSQNGSQVLPVLRVQAGLSWRPTFSSHSLRLSFGYEYEHWWYVADIFDSRAQLELQGVFFRGEWTF